jgi:membrane-associated phospholipid phosphatase
MGVCSDISWRGLTQPANHVKQYVSKQMLLSLVPLAIWWTVFQVVQYVPAAYKPAISVRALPWLEEHFFGTQVYLLIPEIHSIPVFDLFAALGYALHFVAPWAFGFYLWRANGKQFAFLWCLGWLNALAVITQALFPTAPPWYIHKYGMTPPTYEMRGDPAGLQYADDFLHMKFFHGIYTSSPVVFGSFPSLHAAWPMMIAVFAPQGSLLARVAWFYVIWVWWAAMYLRHHFFVDCVGGALYVLAALNVSRLIAGVHVCLFGAGDVRASPVELEELVVRDTRNVQVARDTEL